MAITQLDYAKNTYEAITDEALDDTPVLNTWYHFEIDGWKHLLSDIVLRQSAVVIPESAYELTIDTKYTDYEKNESGKTIYGLWRIVNVTYAAIATTVSGNNFGSYVSNESLKSQMDSLGSETIAFNATFSTDLSTKYFTLENPSSSISNGQQTIVEIAVSGLSAAVQLFLSTSISGAESGSSSWSQVYGGANGSAILILPFQRYGLYVQNFDEENVTLTVKYKIIDTKIAYS